MSEAVNYKQEWERQCERAGRRVWERERGSLKESEKGREWERVWRGVRQGGSGKNFKIEGKFEWEKWEGAVRERERQRERDSLKLIEREAESERERVWNRDRRGRTYHKRRVAGSSLWRQCSQLPLKLDSLTESHLKDTIIKYNELCSSQPRTGQLGHSPALYTRLPVDHFSQ